MISNQNKARLAEMHLNWIGQVESHIKRTNGRSMHSIENMCKLKRKTAQHQVKPDRIGYFKMNLRDIKCSSFLSKPTPLEKKQIHQVKK